MSLVRAEQTIQASEARSAAVAGLQSWLGGQPRACVLVGPPGSGKSHLLASAEREVEGPIVMPAPTGGDCAIFLAAVASGSECVVIADDLDRFSKGLRESVIKNSAGQRHRLLVAVTELSSRTQSILKSGYEDLKIMRLENPASSIEDMRDYTSLWLRLSSIEASRQAIQDCVECCAASGLSRGYWTLGAFLAALSDAGWQFQGPLSAARAASAYREASSPPPDRPTILVEGYTDRVYFEWLLKQAAPTSDVQVRECDGASKVVEQAIALRNQGSRCVAVLDSDEIGKRLRKQLDDFRHPVIGVPLDALGLPKSAFEHVLQVAEIEDLLPVETVEQYFLVFGQQPELEIRAQKGVRYVVGEADKAKLANWVVEEFARDDVPKLAAFVGEALRKLGVTQ